MFGKKKEPRIVNTAVVIGAGSGIGKATAEKFLNNGLTLFLGDRDLASLEEFKKNSPHSERIVGLQQVDVTDATSVREFVAAAYQHLGAVDVAMNCAGILWVGGYLDEDDDALVRQVDINLVGTMHAARAFTRRMVAAQHGHYINMASTGSILPVPGEASYAASKHGVFGYLRSIREELIGTGVEITAVIPPVVDTRLAAGTAQGGAPLLTPQDVANSVYQAVLYPKFILSMPLWLVPLNAVMNALPQRAYDFAIRRLVPNQAKVVDNSVREKYQEEEIKKHETFGTK
ncbi:MAG: SDR family NAD(P)-dependent oxidoreductase [Trueperella sp.]|nr:SDR family NAD(P)-dependent oxidoreductase [Trueperella sp.]